MPLINKGFLNAKPVPLVFYELTLKTGVLKFLHAISVHRKFVITLSDENPLLWKLLLNNSFRMETPVLEENATLDFLPIRKFQQLLVDRLALCKLRSQLRTIW